jgi:hypothetical protein
MSISRFFRAARLIQTVYMNASLRQKWLKFINVYMGTNNQIIMLRN